MSNSRPILNCDNCGVCCTTMGHPRFFWTQNLGSVVDELWIKLPTSLVNEIDRHLALHGGDENADFGTPCIWFDPIKKNCRHHEHRPQLCRDFQVGSDACLRLRRQHEIQ